MTDIPDKGRAAEAPPGFGDDDDIAADAADVKGWGDYVVPIFVFVFCGVVAAISLTLDEALPLIVGHSMQPRVFPIFLMAVIAVLNIGLVVHVLRNPPSRRRWEPPVTWISAALMVVFWALTEFLDMMIALVVVMFLLSIAWGERRLWLAAALALVTTATIFFSFDLILEVRFPRGILTDRYYG